VVSRKRREIIFFEELVNKFRHQTNIVLAVEPAHHMDAAAIEGKNASGIKSHLLRIAKLTFDL
jgi:hypothetical protein